MSLTLQQALNTEPRLTGPDAVLETRLILCHAADVTHTQIMTWPDKVLTSEQEQRFISLMQQRASGTPLAYLLGYQDFWTLRLEVAPCTLIPRADTETLVELALELLPVDNAIRAADLGTGTGAIALALASECKNWQLIGAELQPEAAALAERNRIANGITNAEIRQGSWFEPLDGHFDLICSNPPYIDETDPHLQQGDVRFEPDTALVAGDEGMADLAWIISSAPDYLHSNGWLLLEHGYQQAPAVMELLRQRGFVDVDFRHDLAGQPRVSFGRWPD